MIKKIDLSGIWNFELDPDKKGIEARLFDKTKNDTITLLSFNPQYFLPKVSILSKIILSFRQTKRIILCK